MTLNMTIYNIRKNKKWLMPEGFYINYDSQGTNLCFTKGGEFWIYRGILKKNRGRVIIERTAANISYGISQGDDKERQTFIAHVDQVMPTGFSSILQGLERVLVN